MLEAREKISKVTFTAVNTLYFIGGVFCPREARPSSALAFSADGWAVALKAGSTLLQMWVTSWLDRRYQKKQVSSKARAGAHTRTGGLTKHFI